MPIFIIGIITFIISYLLLSAILTKIVGEYLITKEESVSDNRSSAISSRMGETIEGFSSDKLGKNVYQENKKDDVFSRFNNTTKGARVVIGSKMVNFNVRNSPLQAFNTVYERTITAIEGQKYEDWLDAVEKIFKMLTRDFFGTIKSFFKFLLSLSRPAEKDDFDSRMNRLNKQREQLEVDKVVEMIKEKTVKDGVYTLNAGESDIPATISNIELNTVKLGESHTEIQRKILVLRANSLDKNITFETQTIIDRPENVSNFDKLEQRLLERLSTTKSSHYDIWLSLGDLYYKNNLKEKAKDVYMFVSRNTTDASLKQKAINGIIAVD